MQRPHITRRAFMGATGLAALAMTKGNSPVAGAAEPYKVPDDSPMACGDEYRVGSDWVQPPVNERFAGGVRQVVPSCLGNQSLAQTGYVDVTAAPFLADPTGATDSTAALQAAVDFARDLQMVTYLPVGTYLISDTITCQQNYPPAGSGAHLYPCVLIGEQRDKPSGPSVGEASGRRPVLLLAPNSYGFDDPTSPKLVVNFRSLKQGDPTAEQTNISFNNIFAGIDIVLGSGNSGAVALRLQGAQGSGAQDCTLDVQHGYTGLLGGSGSGGGHANITVVGGAIGADLRNCQPAAVTVGLTLRGQTQTALLLGSLGSLTLAGLDIDFDGTGPAIISTNMPALSTAPNNGPFAIVDASIRATESAEPAITAERCLYLEDVYVYGRKSIVQNLDGSLLEGVGTTWHHVRHYAHAVTSTPPNDGFTYSYPVYIDGRRSFDDIVDVTSDEPPASLLEPHQLPTDFPWAWKSGFANVRDSAIGAAGDGLTDDTHSLQFAMDRYDTVLLPKGYYRISRTLRMRPGTRLIGVAPAYSALIATEDIGGGDAPAPLIQSANDPAGSAVLAFFSIVLYDRPGTLLNGTYALNWRTGRKSVIRDIWPVADIAGKSAGSAEAENPRNHPFVVASGNGGGRWYRFHNGQLQYGDGYRHLLIDGTKEPLTIYQLNAEHARGLYEVEVTNAHDVTIFGLKSEYNKPVLAVLNSRNVTMFGHGGNASALPGSSLYVIESSDVKLVNLTDQGRVSGGSPSQLPGIGTDPSTWYMVTEQLSDGTLRNVQPLDRPVLYQGAPAGESGAAS